MGLVGRSLGQRSTRFLPYLENGVMVQESCGLIIVEGSPLSVKVETLFETPHDILDAVAFHIVEAKGGRVRPPVRHFRVGGGKERLHNSACKQVEDLLVIDVEVGSVNLEPAAGGSGNAITS